MTNIIEITIKELKALLDNVTGYILLILFIGITYFLFVRTFFLISSASISGLFSTLPWILTLFIPAITMGAIAKEKSDQTIEYLLTKPITALQLATGKILSATTFMTLALFLTLPLTIFVSRLGKLDTGETFAGYLGSIILILVLSSIGVAVSSFFKNQITAFLSSILTIFFLNILGSEFFSVNLPVSLSNLFAKLSILKHYFSISRGVIQVQDIVYFFVIVLIALAITYINLMRIRVTNAKAMIKRVVLSVGFVTIVSGLIIFASDYASGRIDLTSNHKYTLSDVTKEILAEKGKVKIEVYASNNMPTQFQNVFTELKNVLEDYNRIGGSNVELQYLNHDDHLDTLSQLQITPVRFNVYGKDELQVKQGYLAVVIKNENGTKQETIPFVQDISKLEYNLTSLINRVKVTKKQTVAFASGNGEKSLFADYQTLNKIIGADYEVSNVFFGSSQNDAAKTPDLSKYSLLVIANPTTEYDQDSKQAITDYIKSGGKVLYLVNPIDVDTATLSATPDTTRGQLLSNFGVIVNTDLAYDLRYNAPVTVNTGTSTVLYPYPFWVQAILDKNATIQSLPKTIFYPWGSTLNLSGDDWKTLYSSSQYAGSQTTNFTIDPQQNFDQTALAGAPLIAKKEFENGGEIVIAGNSDIFDDKFISGSQGNLLLGLALTEDLAQSKPLSEIQSKNLLQSQFVLQNESQKFPIKYFSPLISIAFLGIIGATRVSRRKKLKAKYS